MANNKRLVFLLLIASICSSLSFTSIQSSSVFGSRTNSNRETFGEDEERKNGSSRNKNSRHAALKLSSGGAINNLLKLRGGGPSGPHEVVTQSFDWACNLGAPAALVAGAVIATIYENLASGDLTPRDHDRKFTKVAKKSISLLLLTSFLLQIISIFVTTVTGTMLLSRDMDALVEASKATSALGWMKENFEFEYLTSRICFLQGLINWLGAITLEHALPQKSHGPVQKKLNRFVAASGVAVILVIMSFYNNHMTFYKNYGDMIWTYLKLLAKRYFLVWPMRPLMIVALPFIFTSGYYLFEGLMDNTTEPEDE